jgi:hypothetical protein
MMSVNSTASTKKTHPPTNFKVTELRYAPITPKIPKIQEGFVCKAEDVIYKNSKVSVLFRLGNLNYVNQLDRK